jgi:UDP-N-acetylglucosamine/UDP-N-acetylgalactosamine diphosphorylase
MHKIKYILCAINLLGSIAQGAEMDPKTLLPCWDELHPKQKEILWAQMQTIDLQELERQRSVIKHDEASLEKLAVFERYQIKGNPEDLKCGKNMIQAGQVGCLIVAGGQGSRLNYTKPKGLYPVTIIKQKSLFQLFAEKILAAGAQAGRPLYVAIMTSVENHELTLESFRENNYSARTSSFSFLKKISPY